MALDENEDMDEK